MTENNNGQAETLRRIDEEWQQFVAVASGFSPNEQLLPNALGHWTVRDVLLHIAAWDDELMKQVEHYRSTGEKIDYGDGEAVDRLNQAQVNEKLGLSLDQVWETLHASHQELLQRLHRFPEETFVPGTYTSDQIAMESLGHYRDHREDLERWRAAREQVSGPRAHS
jgi:hypothetical protein